MVKISDTCNRKTIASVRTSMHTNKDITTVSGGVMENIIVLEIAEIFSQGKQRIYPGRERASKSIRLRTMCEKASLCWLDGLKCEVVVCGGCQTSL